MIHLGVDVWNAADARGTGRYLRAVLAAWEHSFSERVRVTLVIPERFAWLHAARYRHASRLGHAPVTSRARSGDFDAWWFPFNGPSWDAWTGRSVATLHDASPFTLGDDEGLRASFRRAAARCERIVTDSHFAAADLERTLGIAPARVRAIELGVAAPLMTDAGIDASRFGRYVLYVGGTEPRKNLATVFEAMRIVQAAHPDIRLVLVGPQTFALPEHADLSLDVIGLTNDATVAAFFRGAAAFIYASTYEGFGLPILEAMSYGVPVVAAASSSLPEAGGEAARYAEPLDARAFASHLLDILGDERVAADMRTAGLARAAAMTWTRTAEETLRVFEELVG